MGARFKPAHDDPEVNGLLDIALASARWIAYHHRMRLKSAIWVSAYLRRLQGEGIFAAVRRRGAEEAGAVFVKLALLDGTATLFSPAPQTSYDDAQPYDRVFVASTAQPVEEQAVETRLRREIDFDPDAWIVEIEDRQGRHRLDLAKG